MSRRARREVTEARARLRAWRPPATAVDPASGAGWIPATTAEPGSARGVPAPGRHTPGPDEELLGEGNESPGAVEEPALGPVEEPVEPGDSPPRRGRSRQLPPGRHTWGPVAEQWLPESLRDARVDPGRRGGLLLSLIAALAAVAAAVGVWWTRPQPVPVAGPDDGVAITVSSLDSGQPSADGSPQGPRETAGESAALPGRPGSGLPADGAAGNGPIVVSVTGRVHRPGLVTIPADARVADAIAAAGGALDETDLTGLNLAARVYDGDSIVVAGPSGSFTESGSERPETASGGPTQVNLNTADAAALEELPGIGPVTAAAIVAYRQQHGSFSEVAELQAVSGIGPATYERLAPHVTV